MGIRADLSAYLLQKSAPLTVDYGKSLYFSGTDLPGAHPDLACRPGTARSAATSTGPRTTARRRRSTSTSTAARFIMRHPRMDDFFARFVAEECRAVVVNVDYDVAPQVRYPVAQHQAHDVAAWVADHGPELGADGDRVAVGGFSAGGNLAASAALQARDLGSFIAGAAGARACRRSTSPRAWRRRPRRCPRR